MTTTSPPADGASPQQDGDHLDPKDIDSLQAGIEHTREQLGQTVDALTAKLDVKTRARQRLDASTRQVAARADAARTQVVGLKDSARDKLTGEHGDVRREAVLAAAVLTVSLGAILALAIRRRHG